MEVPPEILVVEGYGMTVLATDLPAKSLFAGLDARASRLLCGINALSGTQRLVFRLRYILKLSGEDIAKRMGISHDELERIDRDVIRILRGGGDE